MCCLMCSSHEVGKQRRRSGKEKSKNEIGVTAGSYLARGHDKISLVGGYTLEVVGDYSFNGSEAA